MGTIRDLQNSKDLSEEDVQWMKVGLCEKSCST